MSRLLISTLTSNASALRFPAWTVADREGKELALVGREQGSLWMHLSKRGGSARD